MAWFVRHSFFSPDSTSLPFEPYNDDEYSGRPTRLKIWVPGLESPTTQTAQDGRWCMYCYELEISNGKAQKVSHEAVYVWPTSTGRKTRLFERFEDGTVKASKTFGLGPEKALLERILKPNVSVISTLAQLNHLSRMSLSVRPSP